MTTKKRARKHPQSWTNKQKREAEENYVELRNVRAWNLPDECRHVGRKVRTTPLLGSSTK